MQTAQPSPASDAALPAIIYMSGRRRGTVEELTGSTLYITREGETGVRVTGAEQSVEANTPARLHRSGASYELEVMPDYDIWVNGERMDSALLNSGDVLEIGRNGPMLRYRLYAGQVITPRSMTEVFADCIDGAHFHQGDAIKRTAVLIARIIDALVLRTTVWFRLAVVGALAAVAVSTAYLAWQSYQLEQRIERSEVRMLAMSRLIEQTERKAITSADLQGLRQTLQGGISTAVERVDALEARVGASARVISAASQSVMFLQAAYGFVEKDGGRPLRYLAVGPDGSPLRTPQGGPAVTLEGDGPVVEVQYTGTGFIATESGLVITNRHVALPWEDDESSAVVSAMGLEPSIDRFIGYLPGIEAGFEVSLVAASDASDVAILRCSELTRSVPHLAASTAPPRAGDEVIVLGYPTGIRAMLARTDPEFLEQLQAQDDLDFWTVVEHLASAGRISPLATRGIVGQVTTSAVVYDADTTHGGSGGPVVSLDGQVVAVNAAILPEFGGSNLGVPVAHATRLISSIASRE